MFCTKCGNQLEEGERFCTRCGASAEDGTAPIPAVSSQVTFAQGACEPAGAQANSGRSHTVLIIVIAVAVIAVVLAFAFFMLPVFQGNDVQSAPESATAPASSSDAGTSTSSAASTSSSSSSSASTSSSSSVRANAEYILPESNSRVYSEREFWPLSDYELFIARNEIFARRGRMFDSDILKEYFSAQPWYTGTYPPDEFDSKVTLNEYEKQNANNILELEKMRNSSYLATSS